MIWVALLTMAAGACFGYWIALPFVRAKLTQLEIKRAWSEPVKPPRLMDRIAAVEPEKNGEAA